MDKIELDLGLYVIGLFFIITGIIIFFWVRVSEVYKITTGTRTMISLTLIAIGTVITIYDKHKLQKDLDQIKEQKQK